MKNYIFIILTLFTINTSYAQISLKGKITDIAGQPIIGATISYTTENTESTNGAVTDQNGNFSLELSQTGTYQFNVAFIGMKSLRFDKSFNEFKEYDLGTFVLQEDVSQLQSVEITGRVRTDYNSEYSFSATKVAIKNKELPQAVASVTKELIADRLAFQLPDAVKTVSNVSVTGLYNHYNIRGITQADDGQVINGMRTRQYYFLQPITSWICT